MSADDPLDTVIQICLGVGSIEMEWCTGCLTTSRVTASLYGIAPDGVSDMGYYEACDRCDPL